MKKNTAEISFLIEGEGKYSRYRYIPVYRGQSLVMGRIYYCRNSKQETFPLSSPCSRLTSHVVQCIVIYTLHKYSWKCKGTVSQRFRWRFSPISGHLRHGPTSGRFKVFQLFVETFECGNWLPCVYVTKEFIFFLQSWQLTPQCMHC